jgi:hypothetical protein
MSPKFARQTMNTVARSFPEDFAEFPEMSAK